ncbi:hypothetical protein CXG81DRAFT_18659 [Caulochytrium protostelioides]|uniref:Extracellular membrane protein CFEM domain-containing protein n=1 Tax=Caulochytrium protostelioides TaxID=1555241 RepID=A0A4V1IUS2_9FUNG|nr:hypothetical protein CXG81DRAFT_18659 [Caulochytrium protostelioides]|eukprot:RKP01549.1 hypothetical protein CXG81DRAFT_18659 [Caulochytrium protostelioides]
MVSALLSGLALGAAAVSAVHAQAVDQYNGGCPRELLPIFNRCLEDFGINDTTPTVETICMQSPPPNLSYDSCRCQLFTRMNICYTNSCPDSPMHGTYMSVEQQACAVPGVTPLDRGTASAEAAASTASASATSATDAASSTAASVSTDAANAASTATDAVTNAVSTATDAVTNAVSTATNAVTNAANSASSAIATPTNRNTNNSETQPKSSASALAGQAVLPALLTLAGVAALLLNSVGRATARVWVRRPAKDARAGPSLRRARRSEFLRRLRLGGSPPPAVKPTAAAAAAKDERQKAQRRADAAGTRVPSRFSPAAADAAAAAAAAADADADADANANANADAAADPCRGTSRVGHDHLVRREIGHWSARR